MNLKSKGINAERDLIHKFWETGKWSAIRVAGSGSMKYPSADVIASNKLRTLAIECKVTKDNKKYFDEKEIDDLNYFARFFNAESWIGVKFKGLDWLFVNTRDLEKTEKMYLVDKEKTKKNGLLFEELIK
jgi:Holliday junction resolvase|tara:strand:+ start:159 stop:548 length:390 start_codon:yes stop_codon:yes gene_type:complete